MIKMANYLKSGSGNDLITGGLGNDIIDGGKGNDIYVQEGKLTNGQLNIIKVLNHLIQHLKR